MSEAKTIRQTEFTQNILSWQPWIKTVDEIDATPEQLAAVDAITKAKRGRTYWATLAHDPASLNARYKLFNEVMSGNGGGPKSDRELAATATSRVTSCIYCASVHARAYSGLVKERATMQRLLGEGAAAELGPRERAIVDYSVKLALHPDQITAGDLASLREAGLSDLEILDVTNASAIFANANRLMATLGEARRPAGTSE